MRTKNVSIYKCTVLCLYIQMVWSDLNLPISPHVYINSFKYR